MCKHFHTTNQSDRAVCVADNTLICMAKPIYWCEVVIWKTFHTYQAQKAPRLSSWLAMCIMCPLLSREAVVDSLLQGTKKKENFHAPVAATAFQLQFLNFLKKPLYHLVLPPSAPAHLPTLLLVDALSFARSTNRVQGASDRLHASYLSAVSSSRARRESSYLYSRQY